MRASLCGSAAKSTNRPVRAPMNALVLVPAHLCIRDPVYELARVQTRELMTGLITACMGARTGGPAHVPTGTLTYRPARKLIHLGVAMPVNTRALVRMYVAACFKAWTVT